LTTLLPLRKKETLFDRIVLGRNVFMQEQKHDMKKLITSAGMAVLGAASLNAQQMYAPAPGLTTQQLSKPWSVSAAVRGFYDDNYAMTPTQGVVQNGVKVGPQSSWGYEVTPSVGLNWAMEQTYIGLSYIYSAKYYEDRTGDKWDQSHQANFKLSHAFTDRYKLDIADSFVATREPDLIAPVNAPAAIVSGSNAVLLRSEQDVLRNYGTATVSAGLTEQLSLLLGYSNTLYDYQDNNVTGSLSSLMDRMEHLAMINLRWQALPSTVALIGYQWGLMDFTGDQHTGIRAPGLQRDLWSDERNSQSHYIYAGVDQSFNPAWDASLRAGAQIVDYYNYPDENADNTNPYFDANTTYRMTPDSNVQLGVRYARTATDAAALDQQNLTAYGSFNYKILPQLTGSLLGQYQYNTFGEGQIQGTANYADKAENFWLAGINLTYEINKFLAAEVGYNYDRLDSDISSRTYTRNRAYLGLRASY
jgi:hypothetical protein